MSTVVRSGAVAPAVAPLVRVLLGESAPVRIEFWDGSALGPDPADAVGTIKVLSNDALRRILFAPSELGLGRAYVAGDLDVEGDIVRMIEVLRDATPTDLKFGPAAAREALVAAKRVGALGRPLPPPPEEARLGGWRHSLRRDARAISHHYDVGNDFYRIVLGPSMTYSCARFVTDVVDAGGRTGGEARSGLPQGRVCTSGPACGCSTSAAVGARWRSMPPRRTAFGWSASRSARQQAERARKRVAEAGVGELVEIRLQDYRELGGEQFDAI